MPVCSRGSVSVLSCFFVPASPVCLPAGSFIISRKAQNPIPNPPQPPNGLPVLCLTRLPLVPRHRRPELEVWRCIDAPARVGGEGLGVPEFVKIFQLEVEGMLVSCQSEEASPPLKGFTGGDGGGGGGGDTSGVL